MDKEIVRRIKVILDKNNRYVKQFRKARTWYRRNKKDDFKLKIIENRQSHGHTYGHQTSSEVAALIAGDGTEEGDKRGIILCHRKKGFQRINEAHPAYMSLQYPLLFPYREDG